MGLLNLAREGAASAVGECGSSRCAELYNEALKRLLIGELPLRGAAQLSNGGCCFWGAELPLL